MMLKTMVLAPIPSASESRATRANPGLRVSVRRAYRTSDRRSSAKRKELAFIADSTRPSPTDRLALQLLLQPRFERREVIEDGRGVHLTRSGERVERVRPRPRRTHRQYGVQPAARLLTLVDGAPVKRARAASSLCEGTMKLELENVGEKITRVRRVVRHVVFCARIEELFTARRWRRDALIFQAQIPPGLVVVGWGDLASEH